MSSLYFFLPNLSDQQLKDNLSALGLSKKFKVLKAFAASKPIFSQVINSQEEAGWVAKAHAWPEKSSSWLKINLANFHLSQTRVYLNQIPLELQADEQAELLEILQSSMQNLGQVFLSPNFGFYLNLSKPSDIVLPNPYSNPNAELTGFKISGQDAMLFEKALTELQMALYQGAINRRRQGNQLPSIDGAYFSADQKISPDTLSCYVDTIYTDMVSVDVMANLCQVKSYFFKQDLGQVKNKCLPLEPSCRRAFCFEQNFVQGFNSLESKITNPILEILQGCIINYPLAQITLVTREATWQYQSSLWQKLKSCLLPQNPK